MWVRMRGTTSGLLCRATRLDTMVTPITTSLYMSPFFYFIGDVKWRIVIGVKRIMSITQRVIH